MEYIKSKAWFKCDRCGESHKGNRWVIKPTIKVNNEHLPTKRYCKRCYDLRKFSQPYSI